MAIIDDALVIGGDIAACTAALSATGTDVRVRLFARKKSTLQQANGLVDVLSYAGGDSSLSDPYTDFDALPKSHPYHIAGEDGVHTGLRIFDEAVGDVYHDGRTDSNAFATARDGVMKSTARHPALVAPDLASSSGDTLLVGFAGLTDFDTPIAVDHLTVAGVLFSVRGVTVEFPKRLRADARMVRLTKAPDHDEDVDGDTVRSVLADTVTEELGGGSRTGFSAMPGDDHDEDARAKLSNRLGVPVFEVPTRPPSLLGLKLEDILFNAFDKTGVRISTGNLAVDSEAGTGRVEIVAVDQKSRPTSYSAGRVVLVAGSPVGKGLDPNRESITEPVSGCHVLHPEDRHGWSDPEAFDDYAFTRFGVAPDDEFRPTNKDGEPHFENLRTAGSVISGADITCERSTGGVSLATGAIAGRLVGEKATRRVT